MKLDFLPVTAPPYGDRPWLTIAIRMIKLYFLYLAIGIVGALVYFLGALAGILHRY